VVVVHEVPGITPEVVRFADECVTAGFTVVMPSLVGEPGRAGSAWYGVTSMARVCVAKEFTTWATRRTSPVVGWLNALARELHEECGGPGVGAVGMCFSGGFALAMMVEPAVVAPVCSQPSLPLPVGRARTADLGVSDEDLNVIRRRAASGCQVMALRYEDDPWVGRRFDSLRREVGSALLPVELRSPSRFHHSVLAKHRDDDAVRQVIDFLRAKLLSS
jgi:dienelactone hydrolase